MAIEWLRDLVICISGLVIVGVLIFIAVILYALYQKTKSIVDSIEYTAKNISGISSYAAKEVVKPLVQVAALIQGVRQGINAVSKIFKKQEGGKDD